MFLLPEAVRFEEHENITSGICSGSRAQEQHFNRQSQAIPITRTNAVKDASTIMITILSPVPSFFFLEISTPKGFTIVPLLPPPGYDSISIPETFE